MYLIDSKELGDFIAKIAQSFTTIVSPFSQYNGDGVLAIIFPYLYEDAVDATETIEEEAIQRLSANSVTDTSQP